MRELSEERWGHPHQGGVTCSEVAVRSLPHWCWAVGLRPYIQCIHLTTMETPLLLYMPTVTPNPTVHASDTQMPHQSLGTHAEQNVLKRPQWEGRRPVMKWVLILGFNLSGFNPHLQSQESWKKLFLGSVVKFYCSLVEFQLIYVTMSVC